VNVEIPNVLPFRGSSIPTVQASCVRQVRATFELLRNKDRVFSFKGRVTEYHVFLQNMLTRLHLLTHHIKRHARVVITPALHLGRRGFKSLAGERLS
jgi:hypothetical protein